MLDIPYKRPVRRKAFTYMYNDVIMVFFETHCGGRCRSTYNNCTFVFKNTAISCTNVYMHDTDKMAFPRGRLTFIIRTQQPGKMVFILKHGCIVNWVVRL